MQQNKRKKKFYIINLGCRVNRSEIDEYSALLLSKNWEYTDIFSANLIIVNTCTVTAVADKKARQAVRKVCKENKNLDTKIIVTGCSSAIHYQFYKELDTRISVIKKAEVLQYLRNLIEINVMDIDYKSAHIFRSRSSIKIQDGCNNNCSFCIVHVARGKSISYNPNTIKNKLIKLLDAGYKEIVLTGINLGDYKYDNLDLADLCNILINCIKEYFDSDEVNARIRLSSIEPQNVSDKLLSVIKNSNGIICKYMHLPLQSGSSKVLKEMRRLYTAQEFENLIDKIYKNIPDMALSSDIIVGFPGETKEDFNLSYEMAKKSRFMKIHVFPYSKREGTQAASRKDQVLSDVKKERANKLRNLSDILAAKDLKSRQGNFEYAICEAQNKFRTESYHLLDVEHDEQIGNLKQIQIP